MSDSNPNIAIPVNTWVDIYSTAGITVGDAIAVLNIGICDIYLAVQAIQPSPDHDSYTVIRRADNGYQNSPGDSGAWAFCQGSTGKLSVRRLF